MAEAIALGFACGAGIDRVRIIGVEGHEWIHRPFEVDVVLGCFGDPLTQEEINAVVGSRAVLAIGEAERDRIHGVIESVEHKDGPRSPMQVYVARLIPEVGLLTKNRRSTVYQNLTIPELVTAVLTAAGLAVGDDFELRVRKSFTKREYIVQYQESDWDFIARWLEHEGIFTHFEHFGDRSMLVLHDSNETTTAITEPSAIPYRLSNNLSAEGASIWDVTMRDKQVPRVVSVVDYNYRKPAALIRAAHKLDAPAFGHVALYGDHFKDDAEATAIAQVRGEEAGTGRRTMTATTSSTAVRAGYRFVLENHYVADYDKTYLVVEAHFKAGVPVPAGSVADDAYGESSRYRTTLQAVLASQPFRPERRTAWPSIHGVVSGHVQSDGSGQTAEIDEHGRYKVRMPFDLATKPGMAASRWVRKAQPYAGAGYGMHFPLHKGTEVLIAHIDGDPDRPLIVGAVHHAATPGPVNTANATQSVIQSATGIRVEMEDNQG
jgi:type VI secretion system secreted protein VgrG